MKLVYQQEKISVENTPFDFTKEMLIGERIDDNNKTNSN